MNFSHRFITFYNRTGWYLTRCTIAWEQVGNRLEYGLSWCNPEDSFSRAEGRSRAVEDRYFDSETGRTIALADDQLELTREEQLQLLLPVVLAQRPNSWRNASWVEKRVPYMGSFGTDVRKYCGPAPNVWSTAAMSLP